MTLIISTITSDGIVMTADSRQTYTNKAGAIRVGSDSAMKLFKLNDKIAVSISGRAFLSEEGQGDKNVGFFIKRFARECNFVDKNIRQVAEELDAYLSNIFIARESESLKVLIRAEIGDLGGTELNFTEQNGNLIPYTFVDSNGNNQARQGEVGTISMIVAGIDTDGVGKSYSVVVSKGVTQERDTNVCGAMWFGQTDVLVRIIKGRAPEFGLISYVNSAFKENALTAAAEMDKLEYIINWGTMTIQDAVDFGVLMTKTTESIQRFSDGFHASPGGIQGVGGEIDIVVITPDDGVQWLSMKKVKNGKNELLTEESAPNRSVRDTIEPESEHD